MRIALIGNFTLELLTNILEKKLSAQKLNNVKVMCGQFDQWQIELRDEGSFLYRNRIEALLLLLDPEKLFRFEDIFLLSDFDYEHHVNEIVDEITGILREKRGALNHPAVFISNFFIKESSPYRLLEYNFPYSQNTIIDYANYRLFKNAQERDIRILDLKGIVERYGYESTLDRKYEYLAKNPFSLEGLNLVADRIIQYVNALRGIRKKCIIVDFDNTLWGGIIGEEGIEKIVLSNDGPGKAYYDFQRELLNLRSQGYLLAACSKNNPDDVLKVLEKHPYSILKPHHFACLRINWNDKVSNIMNIADELNVGLDSLLFIDDDPRECELVRQQLPEVSVLQLPSDSSKYRRVVLDLNEFNALGLTSEDRERPQLYGQERKRKELKRTLGSLEDYYRSLKMKLRIKLASESEIPRVAQLTQKTNQFNLTTKRYTAQQIKDLVESKNHFVFALHLTDKFGDSGLVGVAIIKQRNGAAELDSFLLSCRVLGRTIESALLKEVFNFLFRKGITKMIAHFFPTKKNQVARDFLPLHKFKKVNNQKYARSPIRASKHPNWINITEKPC